MPRKSNLIELPRGELLNHAECDDEARPSSAMTNDFAAMNRHRFARYITDRREAVGLSQSELAARAGITRSLMSAIETGKIGLPSIDKRRALAEALRVRHIDLLVAAGEITEDELGAGTPRDFVKYPELQRDIELISPDAAEALHDLLYFLIARTPPAARAGFNRPAGRAAWLEAFRTQRERLTGDRDAES